jgi:hypothetical protein
LASFATGQAAIAENLETNLLCFQNDTFWAMGYGVDYFSLLGGFNTEATLLLQVRSVISNSFGVTSINSVSTTQDANSRNISISFDANSIYTQFSGTVQPPGQTSG